MSYRVRTIYLIPTDKTEYATAMMVKQAQHIQAWYQWQLQNSKTFTLNDNIVEVLHSTHPSTWFQNTVNGNDPQDYFFNNVRSDVQSFLGVGQADEDRIMYVDSLPLDGQKIGGHPGEAVMSGADIAGIMGNDPYRSQCWVVGGSAHETGHSFGLPHPTNRNNYALMWLGYVNYPGYPVNNCYLQQADKDILNASPFFTVLPTKHAVGGLCPFNHGSPPHPPRP